MAPVQITLNCPGRRLVSSLFFSPAEPYHPADKSTSSSAGDEASQQEFYAQKPEIDNAEYLEYGSHSLRGCRCCGADKLHIDSAVYTQAAQHCCSGPPLQGPENDLVTRK